jgi:SAM-dependent methyltransferase
VELELRAASGAAVVAASCRWHNGMRTPDDAVSPDYSPYAGQYARTRPTYPPALFDRLAALVERRDVAWDCATGSGQAARDLAERFAHVVATDLSAEQVRQAPPHPRIEYRVCPAERSGLADASVDLTTVASALHWFDLDAFYAEARRVLRPGGILAAWTYHVGHVEPPFGELFEQFYHDVLASYFDPGARLVDRRYETITLPGTPVEMPPLRVTATWTLADMLAFIGSWSGVRRYMAERGADPVPRVADPLARLWGDPDTVRTIQWPLYVRASRL